MSNLSAKTSAIACVLIDGDKIRSIRQEQGLTQLYVATSLGVTTDTVSRWENKRSPSIKQENAEKLAEVLEVDLGQIVQDTEPASESVPPPVAEPVKSDVAPPPVSRKGMWVLPLVMISLVVALLVYKKNGGVVSIPVEVTAERLLPKHGSPHMPFPVLIRVHAADQAVTSFILRESFPETCVVTNGLPAFTAQNAGGVKWIETTGAEDLYFGYLANSSGMAQDGEKLVFDGVMLVDNRKQRVTGATTVEMSNYHWADRNNDYRIDDNEILAIYSSFERFKQMGVDIDQIQAIWAGYGYRFDLDRKEFIVMNETTASGGE
jgi:DNA-binding XRE family transcriptional regulator